MKFSLETILSRESTRSFDGGPLGAAEERALAEACDSLPEGPFGGKPRVMLVGTANSGLGGSGKIGTYGLVSGVSAFLVGAVARGDRAMEDFGWAMEGLVLEATRLGLGSCWIGGLFDRAASARVLGLREEELMPSVVALGKPAARRRLPELLTRRAAGAGKRKDPAELFFDGDFDHALGYPEAGPWAQVLEAVRRGPSASNKQPWRLLRTGGSASPSFHLFLEEDRLYNAALGPVRIQNIDMGIAMRHLEEAAGALGLPGTWIRLPAAPAPETGSRSYVASWI